jgi:hypothetical protein
MTILAAAETMLAMAPPLPEMRSPILEVRPVMLLRDNGKLSHVVTGRSTRLFPPPPSIYCKYACVDCVDNSVGDTLSSMMEREGDEKPVSHRSQKTFKVEEFKQKEGD